MSAADTTTRSAVSNYIELIAKGNAAELTELYAEDATIEDPVGSEVRRGHAAIRDFYTVIENLDREAELVSLKVTGNEAAFLWRLTLTAGDTRSQIEPIDTMTFGDDGKITSMRAFWSPADLRVLE